MKTKRCTKCHEVKPLNEFYRDQDKKDRHKYECKYCELEKKRKNFQKNNEKFKERNRKYYQNNSEKLKEMNRKYYLNNLEKVRKTQRKYRHNNKRKRRYYSRKYYLNNLEKLREYSRKYNLKRRQRLWQSKPKTPKELIEMCRMLLSKLLKAGKQKDYEQLKSLRAKCNQLRIMLG